MEGESSPERPFQQEAWVKSALADVTASQVAHLRAMTRYSQNPSERNITSFNETSTDAAEALKMSVGIIGSCTDLSPRSRAEHITGLCLGAEEARLNLLREITPTGKFLDSSQTPDEVADMFEELIESGVEPTELGAHAYENYLENYSIDLQEFLGCISPTSFKRVIWRTAAKQAGAEIGKIAAGVTLGSLAAYQLLKKRGQ